MIIIACPKCKKEIKRDHKYRLVEKGLVEHVNCDAPTAGEEQGKTIVFTPSKY